MSAAATSAVLTIAISFADRDDHEIKVIRWACVKEHMTRAEFLAAAKEVEEALMRAGWPRSIPIETHKQPLPANVRLHRH
jgi:hypothetical protein